LALVRTAEPPAFLAPPKGHFPTLWAGEFHRSLPREYHAPAPVA